MDTIPAETLLDILTRVRPSTEPDWTQPASSFYSWITISHVCREWRELMLAQPAMWDHLLMAESYNPTINEAAAAFLARAAEIPLHLYLVVGPTSLGETANSHLPKLLEQAVPRTTHISICLNREAALEPLWSKLRIPAPLLSDFYVLNTAAFTFPGAFLGPVNLTPWAPNHIIPRSTLFNEHTPLLQAVRLTHLYNPLPMTLVRPGLKRLELKGYDKHHMGSIPIDLMQGVAATLTELVLLSAADYDVAYPVLDLVSPKVAFPALESLVVYGTVNYIPAILNRMAFPTTTIVRVRLHYPIRGGIVYFDPFAAGGVQVQPDEEALIEALMSLFTPENPVVAVSIADDHKAGCRFWNTLGANPDVPEATPRLTLVNAPKRMDVVAFVRRLALDAVQIFHIFSTDPVDVAPWIPAVRSMSSVHHAEIAGNGAVAFFAQLMGEHDGRFLLRTLKKAGFFFGQFEGDVQPQNPFQVFADAVAFRVACETSALKEVWFTQCKGFEGPAIDSLRKVVERVDIGRSGL